MRRRALALALAGATLLACNALTGLDQDYRLAGPVAAEEAGGDAELDASPPPDAPDVPDTKEAGGDASLTSLDCTKVSPDAIFCADFETESEPPTWSPVAEEQGTLTVEANAGRNGTRGLRAANADGASSYLLADKPVDWQPGQTLTMRFSFRVHSANTYAVLGAFQFNGTEQGLAVYPWAENCNGAPPCVDENDPSHRGPRQPIASSSIALGQWYEAAITLTPNGAWEGLITVDGKPVYESNQDAMVGDVPTRVQILAGVFYLGTPGSAEVSIDDVLVTLQ